MPSQTAEYEDPKTGEKLKVSFFFTYNFEKIKLIYSNGKIGNQKNMSKVANDLNFFFYFDCGLLGSWLLACHGS